MPMQGGQMMFYAVAEIATGGMMYLGGSEVTAAEKLTPGRCYAKGQTEMEARALCLIEVRKFQMRSKP